MPVTPNYPGVYIEELPDGVRTISGVETSTTAFIGRARRGPVDEPIQILSWSDFERQFGGLWGKSTMSYAVQHYFLNGGRYAIIIRVVNNGKKATISLPIKNRGPFILEAASEGAWGNGLRVAVDYSTKDPSNISLFNLIVQEMESTDSIKPVLTETFYDLSTCESDANYIVKVLAQSSNLVKVNTVTPYRPEKTVIDPSDLTNPNYYVATSSDGDDGDPINDNQISADDLKDPRKGLYALDKVDFFNILCIPPLSWHEDVWVRPTLVNAAKYCKDKGAMLIVDPPKTWINVDTAKKGIATLRKQLGTDAVTNAAIYFPRLRIADTLGKNRIKEITPGGAITGLFARTDSERGVWRAPAGTGATIHNVKGLSCKLTDSENGLLNRMGINCLRTFPTGRHVVWGARTLQGSRLASEWKYIPVRRLALFLEESLYRGTKWVVFEPNDKSLWAQIRLNVGAFMHGLWKEGALQGKTPREAYFVKCDRETTTQNDIDRGIVNILVGFAPLKPAEFIIIRISQTASQV